MAEKENAETTNTLLLMANAGRLHERERTPATTAKNKSLFNKNTTTAHTVAHVIVHHGHAVTSVKTWAEKGFKSGLQANNASALCLSAWSLVQSLGFDTISASNAGKIKTALNRACLEYFDATDDDDDDDFSDEDLLGASDEPSDDDLIGELADDESTDNEPSASVDAPFITYTELAKANATAESRNAMVQGAMGVFFGDDNAKGEGFQYRYDGKTRTKTKAQLTPSEKSKKTVQEMFVNKVASMCGMNLANIATNRGGKNTKWASDHVFKGGAETAHPDRNINMLVRNRLGTLWCAIVVKSGVSTLDHDMRRYISDETIQAIQEAFVCPDVDLSDAPTYKWNGEQKEYATGWIHAFQRGDGKGRASFSDLMDDATTFL